MDTVTLHSALPDVVAGAPPPEWLHLVPSGTFRGVDGRGPWRLGDVQTVINASMAAGPLPICENHATDLGRTTGIPSPARGWIDRMEARADGLWGHVEWTPTGAQLVTERAYRGTSPVMMHTPDGVISRVLRSTLTNVPNLAGLSTLHSQQETETDMDIAVLRTALGLPDNADEAAVLARVRENALSTTAHSQAITAIAAAAGVTATDQGGLITALQTQRASAVSPETVVTLQSQLNTLQAERAREKAVAFVDGAIKAGKPVARCATTTSPATHRMPPRSRKRSTRSSASTPAA